MRNWKCNRFAIFSQWDPYRRA